METILLIKKIKINLLCGFSSQIILNSLIDDGFLTTFRKDPETFNSAISYSHPWKEPSAQHIVITL